MKFWKKNTFSIIYKNPKITPHREDLLTSIDDAMYFYYDISVLDENKILFNSRTHDFPKIQDLPVYIDQLLEMEEKDMFLYEDFEEDGFHRRRLYYFATLDDSYSMDMEYFYKIERDITYVKQRDEEEFKRYEEFTLTIGQNAQNKNGYSNGEDFGQSVYIKYLTREDMLNLKETAEEFCKYSIDNYNEHLREYKIKCSKCKAHQLYLDSLLPQSNDNYYEEFRCTKCGHEFDINDDYFID